MYCMYVNLSLIGTSLQRIFHAILCHIQEINQPNRFVRPTQ